jgi:hypothetical protein
MRSHVKNDHSFCNGRSFSSSSSAWNERDGLALDVLRMYVKIEKVEKTETNVLVVKGE